MTREREPHERMETRGGGRASAGTTMAEALVALLLGLFLVHLGFTTVQRIQRHERMLTARVDELSATRIARSVLRGELARGVGGSDWIPADDSIAARAFRGGGSICQVGPDPTELTLAFRGERQPEPAKDSVELLGDDGSRSRLALEGVAAPGGACVGADTTEVPMTWRLSGTVPSASVYARMFERGSYHFAGSALRYRIGSGGRQPLTPQVWRDAGTGFAVSDSSADLVLELRRRGAGSREFLGWTNR